MRSSEFKHCADAVYLKHCIKKEKWFKKTSTLVFALIVAVSIIVIPCTTLAFNVYALTDDSKAVVVAENIESPEKSVKKVKKAKKIKETEPATEKETVAETTAPTEPETVQETTEATQEAVAVANTNVSGYNPEYVQLTSYDRAKLERLVTGEAASLGYEGCALVAQAIRDTMNMTGITSIDKIIADYQYTGSTDVEATEEAKKAVSHIFDSNGYAVNHRIIYFYAPDLVNSPWHETQNYVTSCGNMRFFDINV